MSVASRFIWATVGGAVTLGGVQLISFGSSWLVLLCFAVALTLGAIGSLEDGRP